MPSRPTNRRNDGDQAAGEWAVGSLPVGSWVELYDLSDVLIYRGVVKDQRATWGYTVVMPITEGDGNFIGHAETWSIDKVRWDGQKKIIDHVTDGTLERIYDLGSCHKVQSERPVTWLGVDQELASELAAAGSPDRTRGDDGHLVPTYGRHVDRPCMSLLPVVSLIPEEVYDDRDEDR